MKKYKYIKALIKLLSILSLSIIFLILIFLFLESMPFLKKEGLIKLLKPGRWNPISQSPEFSVFNMIVTSLYLFIISITLALPISVGASIFITFYLNERFKNIILRTISILAGIPSIIMGFIGLLVVVKLIEKGFKISSGESVLASGIVVSVMVIPFILNSTTEYCELVRKRYFKDSSYLGISKEFFIRNLLLKELLKPIIIGIILAFSRTIGETMAVMMVIGNTPVFPKLIGKAETIPGLIAIEMGMAEVGSIHYSALFSVGLILLLIIILINILIQIIKTRGMRNEN